MYEETIHIIYHSLTSTHFNTTSPYAVHSSISHHTVYYSTLTLYNKQFTPQFASPAVHSSVSYHCNLTLTQILSSISHHTQFKYQPHTTKSSLAIPTSTSNTHTVHSSNSHHTHKCTPQAHIHTSALLKLTSHTQVHSSSSHHTHKCTPQAHITHTSALLKLTSHTQVHSSSSHHTHKCTPQAHITHTSALLKLTSHTQVHSSSSHHTHTSALLKLTSHTQVHSSSSHHTHKCTPQAHITHTSALLDMQFKPQSNIARIAMKQVEGYIILSYILVFR